MNYTVTFVQYHTYEVDAMDEDEAFHNAYDEFQSDMRSSIANTFYDYFEVECNEDECDEDE
jgi:hypothetical protein